MIEKGVEFGVRLALCAVALVLSIQMVWRAVEDVRVSAPSEAVLSLLPYAVVVCFLMGTFIVIAGIRK